MASMRKFIVNIFIGGAIVLLPIIIIFQIGQWLFDVFQQTTQPLTYLLMRELHITEPAALGLTLIAIFVAFSFIGMVVRTRIGHGIYLLLENITLVKIPGYTTIKDIVAQITGKQKGLFKKVVLVKVGNTGVSATGFVVDEINEHYSSVFIPCGPNPTTGFILHMRNEDILVMNISVETAMKTVIACGSGSSQFIDDDLLKAALSKPVG